jgi:hypothetical protein
MKFLETKIAKVAMIILAAIFIYLTYKQGDNGTIGGICLAYLYLSLSLIALVIAISPRVDSKPLIGGLSFGFIVGMFLGFLFGSLVNNIPKYLQIVVSISFVLSAGCGLIVGMHSSKKKQLTPLPKTPR